MKILLTLGIAFTASMTMHGQSKMTTSQKIEATVIQLEKDACEAWKNNNPAWVQEHSMENFWSVSSAGISTKADVLASVPVDCKIKSFVPENFKFNLLNKKTALLSYTTTGEGTCEGEKIPKKARASVIYIKQHGKWMEAFFMDTPIVE